MTRPHVAVRRPSALTELALVAALYVAYSATRLVVDADPAAALRNGQAVLSVERLLGLDVEKPLVDWLVGSTALSVAAGYVYALLHYTVTPAVLVWLYRAHPAHYRRARLALVLATAVALVVYALLPTAPPRLLGEGHADVLALTADWGWWGADASAPEGLGSFTNQYAALPSMHVGWAVWCGALLAWLGRSRAVRTAGVLYPLLITAVVVVTGNHWVLDAVAGAALVVAALLLSVRGLSSVRDRRRTGMDPAAVYPRTAPAPLLRQAPVPASSCSAVSAGVRRTDVKRTTRPARVGAQQ